MNEIKLTDVDHNALRFNQAMVILFSGLAFFV